MKAVLREAVLYAAIGTGFGILWAVTQYTNGQIRNLNVLVGPVIGFGAIGLFFWIIRRAVYKFFRR